MQLLIKGPFPFVILMLLLLHIVHSRERKDASVQHDFFINRAVVIVALGRFKGSYKEDQLIVAPGIAISGDVVLTTFNPFRKLVVKPHLKNLFLIKPLQESSFFNFSPMIICARQIIPLGSKVLKDEEWFGKNRRHSPVHDLMLIQVDEPFNFANSRRFISLLLDVAQMVEQSKKIYDFITSVFSYVKTVVNNFFGSNPYGPALSILATPEDEIGDELAIGCIGCFTNRHIWTHTYMYTQSFEPEDQALEDCNEWFPRIWGLFICVRNVYGFEGVGSGSILMYNNRIFGLGSFMLEKGNDSILVFTDVRPYYDSVNFTCPIPTTTPRPWWKFGGILGKRSVDDYEYPHYPDT